MRFASPPRLAASLASLALWALVAASALYWVWRVRTPPLDDAPLAGNLADAGQADPQAVARGLGAVSGHAATGAADMAGRFVLRGVVTHGPDSGAALISVDGKPPRPVRVGEPVAGAEGWSLRAVTPRGAVLADGARDVTLAVPQPESNPDARVPPGMRPAAQAAGQVDMRGDTRADARTGGGVLPVAESVMPPRILASRTAPAPALAGANGPGGS